MKELSGRKLNRERDKTRKNKSNQEYCDKYKAVRISSRKDRKEWAESLPKLAAEEGDIKSILVVK